jgi:hypothetical protein
MFIKTNFSFTLSLFSILILFCANPTLAVQDISAENPINLNYIITGKDISTPNYGKASGDGNTQNPGLSLGVGIKLQLVKFLAMSINTSSPSGLVPGASFKDNSIPLSKSVVKSDINDLKTNSVKEFEVEGLVASNDDNIKLQYDQTLTLTHINGSSYGQFTVDFTGVKGGIKDGGYIANLASGDDIDNLKNKEIGKFKLMGNINPSSVDSTADRAGVYTTIISVSAIAQ